MTAKEKHQCEERVYSGARYDFGGHRCGKNAVVEHDGKWYCKIHDPEYVKVKRAEMEAQWDRNHAESLARIRHDEAMRHYCDGLTVEYMETHRATEWLKIEDLAEGMMRKGAP